MAKNKIFVSALAQRHLKGSYEWYEQQQLSLGDEFRKEISEYFNKLGEGYVDYQIYHDSIRKVGLRRFPYYIYYIREPERIVILAVFHFKRSPDDIRAKLK